MPPGFSFLASKGLAQPGFNPLIFACLGVLFILSFSFLLVPKIFGIQSTKLSQCKTDYQPGRLPKWFYAGLVLNISAWAVMWGDYSLFLQLTHYMFVPLWAGFILMLDGILHKRNFNQSFISQRPRQFLAIVLLSIAGWYYFEYLNFFILKNWYYPNLYLIPAPWTYFWAALTYASVWPGIFLIYNILMTFKTIPSRYSKGKPITLKPYWLPLIFIAGVILFLLSAVYPSYFFWLIWLGPLLIICSSLAYLKIWTPLSDLRQGNWSRVLVMALAALVCGFFWEFWNWQSFENNANFWQYDLPYVHVLKIFEMPILGYSGYLFFGMECWVMYITCANLLGLNSDIELVKHEKNSGIRTA